MQKVRPDLLDRAPPRNDYSSDRLRSQLPSLTQGGGIPNSFRDSIGCIYRTNDNPMVGSQ